MIKALLSVYDFFLNICIYNSDNISTWCISARGWEMISLRIENGNIKYFSNTHLWSSLNSSESKGKERQKNKKTVNLSLFGSLSIWWQKLYSVSSSFVRFHLINSSNSGYFNVWISKEKERDTMKVACFRLEWILFNWHSWLLPELQNVIKVPKVKMGENRNPFFLSYSFIFTTSLW